MNDEQLVAVIAAYFLVEWQYGVSGEPIEYMDQAVADACKLVQSAKSGLINWHNRQELGDETTL